MVGSPGISLQFNIVDFAAVSMCKVDTCSSSGTCTDMQDSATVCDCDSGFTGDDCSEALDFCLSSPCAGNSSCVSTTSGFNCLCPGNDNLSGGLCHEGILGNV